MKKILIVDDDEAVLQFLSIFFAEGELSGTYQLLQAVNCKDAIELFKKNQNDIVAVCLDASLIRSNPRKVDTYPVLNEVKLHNFKGPIITMSSDPFLQMEMCKAGCTHSVKMKTDVMDILEELLLKKVA
ncbi:MAG: hypothetical protein WCV55_02020 [Candidatus Paceibacterota bacterium]